MITSSWPSRQLPWAGHFVADHAGLLAASGYAVRAVALQWGEDPLVHIPGVELRPAACPGTRPVRLSRAPAAGVAALLSLQASAAETVAERWVCHWWPSALALPPRAPRISVLHGGDVELLERLPSLVPLALRVAGRTVAVSAGVARRWRRVSGTEPDAVCPLGAERATASDARSPLSPRAMAWLEGAGPRVLTVARDAPGKGLEVARAARARLGCEVDWLVVTPRCGLGPAAVRRLLGHADIVVVPSLHKRREAPGEGHPHIITQALCAGVALIGGPSEAVVEALADRGQAVVTSGTVAELVATVRRLASDPHARAAAARRAAQAGEVLRWSALGPAWRAQVLQASPT